MIWTRKEPLERGWSADKKYRAEDETGVPFLLRVSAPEKAERKRAMFRMAERVAALGVPMMRPVAFYTSEEGACSVFEWIDGVDAETAIPALPEDRQYAYGRDAGEILRKIHSIPAPAETEDWAVRYNRKLDRNIQRYRTCPEQFEGGENFIRYVNDSANRALLQNRPQVYQHGDYHIGNMMLDRSGRLRIIDFDRDDFGDPWEEFNRITWTVQASPAFARGMVDGYFDGSVPEEFWRLMALYIAGNEPNCLPWAIPFGPEEVAVMKRQAAEILTWYDDMWTVVPTWYFHRERVDGAEVLVRNPFDFGFLSKYGRVFRVFDRQESGNISFGVERDGERFFVKFAGAKTAYAAVSPDEAVANLRAAVPVYRALRGEGLIKLFTAEDVGGGFATVFRWTEGVCPGRMCPEDRKRFLALPVEERASAFRQVLEVLLRASDHGYVAVDLYDGSLLYDFASRRMTVCDVDLFRPSPAVNDMGRMWGSGRFMSPEEFSLGAVLDDRTNVHTAGVFAFALLSDFSRRREDWPLSDALFDAASRAASPDRETRQGSVSQFAEEWDRARA